MSALETATTAFARYPALTVRRLMRPCAAPVGADERLPVAAARMRRCRVGAVVVVDAGRRPVGLITERDLLVAVADGLSTDITCVREYMRPVPVAISPEDAASDATARMIETRARYLPVSRGTELVGMISAGDVLAAWGVPPELIDHESV